MKNLEVIFDNAGFVTVQDDTHAFSFAGSIDTPAAAGESVRGLLLGETTLDDWEGNDPESRMSDEAHTWDEFEVFGEVALRTAMTSTAPLPSINWGSAKKEFFVALTGRELASEEE